MDDQDNEGVKLYAATTTAAAEVEATSPTTTTAGMKVSPTPLVDCEEGHNKENKNTDNTTSSVPSTSVGNNSRSRRQKIYTIFCMIFFVTASVIIGVLVGGNSDAIYNRDKRISFKDWLLQQDKLTLKKLCCFNHEDVYGGTIPKKIGLYQN